MKKNNNKNNNKKKKKKKGINEENDDEEEEERETEQTFPLLQSKNLFQMSDFCIFHDGSMRGVTHVQQLATKRKHAVAITTTLLRERTTEKGQQRE